MSYSNPATQKDIEESETRLGKKIDRLQENMDWLIGEYKKHGEEHVLINNRISIHSDKIDKIEKKLRMSSL